MQLNQICKKAVKHILLSILEKVSIKFNHSAFLTITMWTVFRFQSHHRHVTPKWFWYLMKESNNWWQRSSVHVIVRLIEGVISVCCVTTKWKQTKLVKKVQLLVCISEYEWFEFYDIGAKRCVYWHLICGYFPHLETTQILVSKGKHGVIDFKERYQVLELYCIIWTGVS